MSYIKRRHFLQFAGSTLATLGLSQLDIMQQGDRYGKVLAQGTSRKLALLVGINQYSPSDGLPTLEGCVNDVLLQKELLIHRFGFNENDIVTLLDKQATRQNILTAFEQHLINQAKPGDVVVFHFSGHGSQVQDPDRDAPDGLNSTFVPVDSPLPAGYPVSGGSVRNIMGHTLFLLMYALKTDNVTVVLDSVQNNEFQLLYVNILVIDAVGKMTDIFPFNWSAPESAALVEPKQTRVIPQLDDGFKLTIGTTLGFSEALIIASTTPLRTSLKALQEIAKSRGLGNSRSPIPVPDEVLNVTNSWLDDLDAGTRNAINVEGIQLPPRVRGIDTKKLAAMAIAFEVVKS